MGFISFIRNLRFKTPKSAYLRGGYNAYSFSNGDIANNETIFAAVTMLANSIASVPLSIREDYRKLNPSQSNIARLLAYGPNSNMTTFEFMRLMETIRNTKGRAYAIKEYDRFYDVSNIWILDSDFVTPIIDSEKKELWYKISTGDGDYYFHNSHIISVGHISNDGYNSLNPINILRNTLDYDREIKEISINQLKNGLNARLAFKVKANLSDDALDAYAERVRRFRELGVLFLDAGKEVQELKDGNFIDPKTFEVEEITISRVARVFGIPIHKLLGNKASYSSAEQGDLEYLTDSILPTIRMYEQEFTKKLVSEYDRDKGQEIKGNLNGFARADMKTRGDFYQKMIRSAGITSNEIRGFEDLPPLPGGDSLMVSRDLIRLEDLPLLLSQNTAKGGENDGQE